jgi:probable phosphoglycerate mutase
LRQPLPAHHRGPVVNPPEPRGHPQVQGAGSRAQRIVLAASAQRPPDRQHRTPRRKIGRSGASSVVARRGVADHRERPGSALREGAIVSRLTVRVAEKRNSTAPASWPVRVQCVPWPFERVILVRHGETEWNRLGRRQGQLDSPLTSEGERHARAVASLVASTAVDSIFSSPLGRAHRSALIIAAKVGRPVRVLEALGRCQPCWVTFSGIR